MSEKIVNADEQEHDGTTRRKRKNRKKYTACACHFLHPVDESLRWPVRARKRIMARGSRRRQEINTAAIKKEEILAAERR